MVFIIGAIWLWWHLRQRKPRAESAEDWTKAELDAYDAITNGESKGGHGVPREPPEGESAAGAAEMHVKAGVPRELVGSSTSALTELDTAIPISSELSASNTLTSSDRGVLSRKQSFRSPVELHGQDPPLFELP